MFYVPDAHPVLNAIERDRNDDALVLARPYFTTGRPVRYDNDTTYADADVRLQHASTCEWQHSLSEIVQSLLDAGLTLTTLAEHRALPWQALPQMVDSPAGWVLPKDTERLPLAFCLTATKTGG